MGTQVSRSCRAQRLPPGPLLLTRSCPLVHVHTGPHPAALGAQPFSPRCLFLAWLPLRSARRPSYWWWLITA